MAKKVTREELEQPNGRAVLTSMYTHPETGHLEVAWEVFHEADYPNPHESAARLRASIEDDDYWEGHAIILNPRARYLMTKANMERLGLDWDIDQHLEI